jgi:GalNAc-alpha-(1->4)-GalNAc-alpha-(1->3)-diNAcBac-PP-undecaprenol alpha-1,4-N-acetyl-D-galactosaminyltransferase
MRLTLVVSSLRRGGAERAMSLLANAWADRGDQVTLLTFDHGGNPEYPLQPAIQRRSLGLLAESRIWVQGLWRNLHRVRVLRRAIRESNPDIIISLMDHTNVLTLFASRWLGVPVIVGEQIDPSLYQIGRTWNFLRRHTYPWANALVCPANRSLSRFQAMIGVYGCVIPNPFPLPGRVAGQAQDKNGRMMIAMGRLVHQKGFDLLLRAFSMIAAKYPEWSLTVLGEGPLRADLEAQTEALHLAGRVRWAGLVEDPFPAFCGADLFVFSSRFEGFGLALAEAMACGLPVVSFDCPEGPSDIIRNGVDGVLVPQEDVSALAAVLDRLMGDPEERRRIASRAPEVIERFSLGRILNMWQRLFSELVPEKANSPQPQARGHAERRT